MEVCMRCKDGSRAKFALNPIGKKQSLEVLKLLFDTTYKAALSCQECCSKASGASLDNAARDFQTNLKTCEQIVAKAKYQAGQLKYYIVEDMDRKCQRLKSMMNVCSKKRQARAGGNPYA